jgi:hypothetical protein
MPWDLTGNSGIKPTTNFLGTRDLQPLAIRTNNTEKIRVTPTGNVGIGTTQPGAKLEINNGDLLFKAAAEDPGDIIFQSASGEQKARIWSNPGAGPGLHLSSTGNRPNLTLTGDGTILLGNNLVLESGLQLYGRGRLHVNGEEILYILNKAGVVIGKEWGGNGNLSVQGNVTVGGDVMLTGADCAEEFEVLGDEQLEPGTVMVIDEEGTLRPSEQPYDRRVAGVISGGGDYRAGLLLDRQEESEANRMPVTLMGKVACKVEARESPIEVGDLLTTATTPGYAMKVTDPSKAAGAVIGKALQRLTRGQELLPILVSLQ